MSLRRKAVLGALWTITTSISGRAIGLVGTLVLTRFLAPKAYGEVATAHLAVVFASTLTAVGFGQYLVANPKAGRDVAFHASVAFLLLGAISLGAVFFLRHDLSVYFDAPALARFVPIMVLASALDRASYLPGRILARDMRFKILGVRGFAGEVMYVAVGVGLAWKGFGGDAIAWAILARSILTALIFFYYVRFADWLLPSAFCWTTAKKLLRFGIPMGAANFLHWFSRKGDNLLIAALFGPATMGEYNLAYNLADIPATHVGEHIGDVLLPSFARLRSDAERHRALIRASGLLALVVFPMAVGLGAISSTLVRTIFDARWLNVAQLLLVLSVLSVLRPVGWLVQSYLEAMQRTVTLLGLEMLKAGMVVVFILWLHRFGILWACASIGMAFGVSAAAGLLMVKRADGVPVLALLKPYLLPLLACVPMAAFVLGIRAGLVDTGMPMWLRLVVEVLGGVVSYVLTALVVARSQSRDFLNLLKGALRS